MPDDFFKKLPKFGKMNFGTAKVHYNARFGRKWSYRTKYLSKYIVAHR